jgi:hypothetical protein
MLFLFDTKKSSQFSFAEFNPEDKEAKRRYLSVRPSVLLSVCLFFCPSVFSKQRKRARANALIAASAAKEYSFRRSNS